MSGLGSGMLPEGGVVEGLGDDLGDDVPTEKPFVMPTKEELLAMLDTLGLDPKEAEEIRRSILEGDAPVPPMVASSWTTQTLMLLMFVLVIASIMAFTFYGIYRSQTSRERKQLEKKQQKLLKKQKRR